MFILPFAAGNVRAQEKCTITPTNPSSMTVKQSNEITAEGVLVNGTINTILQCVCKNRRGSSLRLVRWYTPIGIQLSSQSNQNRPYNRLTSNSRVGSLIIPLFGDRYKGNYTCGIGSSPSKLSPNITIDLKLGKTLFSLLHVVAPLYSTVDKLKTSLVSLIQCSIAALVCVYKGGI